MKNGAFPPGDRTTVDLRCESVRSLYKRMPAARAMLRVHVLRPAAHRAGNSVAFAVRKDNYPVRPVQVKHGVADMPVPGYIIGTGIDL